MHSLTAESEQISCIGSVDKKCHEQMELSYFLAINESV
jgi:hypothetical protein